ncbi:MAG: DUF2812 domain-containing protein [Clostridiales bacterium]|nr:DUF2812 domain-containing protein [Clostridiales bacterium]
MKKYYRFFGGFLKAQEKWLNQMAEKGYRLDRTGKLSYEFTKCKPGEYQYCIDFVAGQSDQKVKDYKAFLEELGYQVFYKNINLNLSVGKVRWRPYGKGTGQIAVNPGNYNKELLIVEKKNDGRCFELHTTNEDRVLYYKALRNARLTVAVLFLIFSIISFIQAQSFSKGVIGFGLLAILLLIPAFLYQTQMLYFSKKSSIEEE